MEQQFNLPEIEETPEELESNYYQDIIKSPNNFSFWFPKIKDCGLAVPESVIIPVPMDVMRTFFMEREGDKEKLTQFVNEKVMPVIPESFGDRVFLKNGCTSNKFTFKDCSPKRTVEDIVTGLLHINEFSFCVDCGGNAEIIIRKLIGQNDDTFKETIYEGMRLRPEIRVFYDFNRRATLYTANYWDWDYCHDSICLVEEDAKTYEKVYPTLESIYNAQKDYVAELVNEKMKDIDLQGIWSVDLMYAENKWWLIDMALGHVSAYWDPKLANV